MSINKTPNLRAAVLRHLRRLFVVFPASMMLTSLATSCRTTGVEEHILLNSSKSDGTFYSTNDDRTALNNPERIQDLQDLRERLGEHTKAKRDDLNALGTLAQVNVALGDLNAAEAICRTMLRKDLKNSLARKVLGQVALRRSQYDLALIHFSSLGGSNSKDASVINMIAQIELQKGRNNVAMGLFKKAIRMDPNDHSARLNLAVLYIKHRQMALASVELERILKSEPNHIDAKIHLAIVMLARQEIAAAKASLEEVLDLDENNPLALYNLAVASRMDKDYDSAIDYLKQYTASNRGKPSDNNQAFALINRIQRSQAAAGDGVSDDEIQDMAEDLRKNQNSVKAKTSAQKPPQSVAQKTPKKAGKPAASKAPESEEIDDLERALK